MAQRRPDPNSTDQALALRHNQPVDESLTNCGTDPQARAVAAPADDQAHRPDYRALHRQEVLQRIRQRIDEPPVTPEEIIGTLASFIRADRSQLVDESGQIDFKLIRERGLDHLIKSFSTAVCETKATEDEPGEVVKAVSVELHSPVQAAAVLARLAGIDPSDPTGG